MISFVQKKEVFVPSPGKLFLANTWLCHNDLLVFSGVSSCPLTQAIQAIGNRLWTIRKTLCIVDQSPAGHFFFVALWLKGSVVGVFLRGDIID